MSDRPPITFAPLDWDSEFLGFRVGRVDGALAAAAALREAVAAAPLARWRLLYAECAAADEAASASCQAAGGRLVAIKHTYARALPSAATLSVVSTGTAVTGPDACTRRQLRALAWQAARHSRYRVDPRMPAGAWRRLYSRWIANSLNGQLADAVLVERAGDHLAGMASVVHRGAAGRIGLIAVAESHRDRGVGRRLIEAAAARCTAAGCARLDVVTQAANAVACRAYESAGFGLADERNVFHFWIES